MNDSDTVCMLEESLENKLDSDDEPLNLPVQKGNYHVVENPTIGKVSSNKAEKEVKGKSREKVNGE